MNKTNLGFSKQELIGLIAGVPAIIISLTYKRSFLGFKITDTVDELCQGMLCAFVLVAIMYAREIIAFRNVNKYGRLLSILVNVILFGSTIAMLLASVSMGTLVTVVLAVTITLLLLGQRDCAKIAVLICIAIFLWDGMDDIGDFLGLKSLVYFPSFFSSLYLQENISFKVLCKEMGELYGRSKQDMVSVANSAADEMEGVGKKVISSVHGALNNSAGTIPYSESYSRQTIYKDGYAVEDNDSIEYTEPDTPFGYEEIERQESQENERITSELAVQKEMNSQSDNWKTLNPDHRAIVLIIGIVITLLALGLLYELFTGIGIILLILGICLVVVYFLKKRKMRRQ